MILQAIILIPPLLVAVLLHEIAHGLVALRLGDQTAKKLGRLTLNPIKHIDVMWTIVIPGLLILSHSPVVFGAAKPVPVNPLYFKDPKRGMMYVAAAGPITNFALATISFALLSIPALEQFTLLFPALGIVVCGWLTWGMGINIVLAVFNLFPIPPLDGGRIAVGLLPLPLARKLAKIEPLGFFIVIGLLFFGVLGKALGPILTLLEILMHRAAPWLV